jgi:hypothetical protein
MDTCSHCGLNWKKIMGGCNAPLCPQICKMVATELSEPCDLEEFFNLKSPTQAITGKQFDPNITQPVSINL